MRSVDRRTFRIGTAEARARNGLAFALSIVFFMAASGRSFGAWQGAQVLRSADPEAPHMTAPHIATDNHGFPWAVWVRVITGHESLEMSQWDGGAWKEPQCVPDTDDHMGTYLDFVFDTNDDLFLVHPTSGPIKSFRFSPGTREWTGPFIVNDDTSSCPYYCYPRIAIGGGEIWAAWFCSDSTQYQCQVRANHWNRLRNEWDPDTIVMPPRVSLWSRVWFPDIAVDSAGVPHIVWTFESSVSQCALYYSRYENGAWRAEERLTPDSLIPVGPYDGTRPRLAVDDRDNLHCCFLGSPPGDGLGRVFYCKYTASTGTWGPIVRLDAFDDPAWPSWDKDIAVSGPDNVWVAYDIGEAKESELWYTYVQHFDGAAWSQPERIDDGAEFRGGFPKITLDGGGSPFVVWAPDNTKTHFSYEIWYNRYVTSSAAPGAFRRGDADADGTIMIDDPMFLLQYLFRCGPAPMCMDAADANDDGKIGLADPIRVLGRIFLGTAPLPAPSEECGVDPSADALDCALFPPCEF